MAPEWIFSSLLCWQYTVLKRRCRQSAPVAIPNKVPITSEMTQGIFSGLQSPFQKDRVLTQVLCHICQPHVIVPCILGCLTWPLIPLSIQSILSKICQMAPETLIRSCHYFLSVLYYSELLRSDIFIIVVISKLVRTAKNFIDCCTQTHGKVQTQSLKCLSYA